MRRRRKKKKKRSTYLAYTVAISLTILEGFTLGGVKACEWDALVFGTGTLVDDEHLGPSGVEEQVENLCEKQQKSQRPTTIHDHTINQKGDS